MRNRTMRGVKVLRRHRYLAGAAFAGMVLSATWRMLMFFSFASWQPKISWFDVVSLGILVAMLLTGLVGIVVSFSRPGSWVLGLVTTVGVVIGGGIGGIIAALLIVWLGALLQPVFPNVILLRRGYALLLCGCGGVRILVPLARNTTSPSGQ